MKNQQFKGFDAKAPRLCLIALFICLAGHANAAKLLVPSEYTTIQSAIDASTDGDTVLVSPGTYVENISFLDRNVLVKSSGGADSTILQERLGHAPTVAFPGGSLTNSKLVGIKITGSTSEWAIMSSHSNPTIEHCVVESCSGSAIRAVGGSPNIRNNVLRNNGGSGIVLEGGLAGSAKITNNSITGNGDVGLSFTGIESPVLVRKNQLIGNGFGLRAKYCSGKFDIDSNIVTHTAIGHAVELGYGDGYTLSFNTLYANSSGIFVEQNDTEVNGTHNIISSSTGVGLHDPNCNLDYSLLWDNGENLALAGSANPSKYFVADPRFVSPESGDFALMCDSPAIDIGGKNAIGAVPFDHNPYAPFAAHLSVLGEEPLHVLSQTLTFRWLSIERALILDTLFCFPIPGGFYCHVDTTFAPQLAYQFEVGTDDDWAVAELMATGEVESESDRVAYNGPPINHGQTYFARLRLRDFFGWGCWRKIVLHQNALSSVPVHVYPGNGAHVLVDDVRLSIDWILDPERERVTALFSVFEDSTLTNLCWGAIMTQWNLNLVTAKIPGLIAGKEYWWQARSHDSHEFSDWSTPTSFITIRSHTVRVPEDQPTLQSAADWAVDGDTILVGPGAYYTSTSVRNKSLTFIGVEGADATIFDLNSHYLAFTDVPMSPGTLTMIGIHFDNAYVILQHGGHVIARDCRFTRKRGVPLGYPLLGPWATITLDHCMFAGVPSIVVGANPVANTSLIVINSIFDFDVLSLQDRGNAVIVRDIGGANPATYPFEVEIANNIFRGDLDFNAVRIDGPTSGIITNNIFDRTNIGIHLESPGYFESKNNHFLGCREYGFYSSTGEVDYNNFWNNAADYANGSVEGTHDISVDPLFVDPANGDYRLQCNSPCIDAGDPATPGCKGKAIDIGAFEFEFQIGNATGNSTGTLINLTDAVFLVNYIFEGGPAPCPINAGRIDCGETIGISDIVHLVNYLYAHGPAPCSGCQP